MNKKSNSANIDWTISIAIASMVFYAIFFSVLTYIVTVPVLIAEQKNIL